MVRNSRYFKLMNEIYLQNAIRKLNLLALAFILAYSLGSISSTFFQILTIFLIFTFFYSSVYFYNDLADYEFDKKREYIPKQKLLARGLFKKEEYAAGFIFSFVFGFSALLILNPGIAIMSAILVFANMIRTKFISSLSARAFSLVFIEFLNLQIFWFAITGIIFNVYTFPIFLSYCIIYSFAYYFYRKNKKISLLEVLKFAPLGFTFIYFSIPVLLDSGLAIWFMIAGLAYGICILTGINKDINTLLSINIIGIIFSTSILISYPILKDKVSISISPKNLPENISYIFYEQPKKILKMVEEKYLPTYETILSNLTSIPPF